MAAPSPPAQTPPPDRLSHSSLAGRGAAGRATRTPEPLTAVPAGPHPLLGPLSLPIRSRNPPPALWLAACDESTDLGIYLELHRAAITPDVRHFPFLAQAGEKRNVKYPKT